MRADVIYDADLRSARRWALVLGLGNAAIVAVQIYRGNWLVAAVAALWVMCCWLMRRTAAFQQKTRDMGRVIEAGVHSRRVIETEDY